MLKSAPATETTKTTESTGDGSRPAKNKQERRSRLSPSTSMEVTRERRSMMRAKLISVTRLVEMGEFFKQFLKGYTLSEIEMLLARQLLRFQRCLANTGAASRDRDPIPEIWGETHQSRFLLFRPLNLASPS